MPANLTAGQPSNGGILYGRVRTANANFSLRTMRPGANPDYTSTLAGPLDMRDYSHGWGGLGAYVQTGIYTTAATTPTSTTNWFDVNEFSVVLHDPHNPGLNILSGHDGWKGPGGACIRYGFGEAGSGLQATALQNLTNGAVYDNPSYASANITTGVFQNDRNCVGIGALATGHYTLRASAVDKSGNGANHDFVVSFDTTQPAMSNIMSGSTAVTDGRVFAGSGEGYRPGFSVSTSDAHSGLASVQTYLDGSHVANAASYTPPSNLSLGTHTIMFRATDAVGNQAQVQRSFVVVDDVRPTVIVAEPAANGSNEPILDITAADDHSGLNTSSWTVSVNGVQLPASGTNRLQMNLGRLANGTHTIVVRIRDNAGNERVHTIEHEANQDTYTAPSPNGLFAISGPVVVYEDGSFHLIAIAVKDGRPLAGQRFELLPPGSTTAIAGKNSAADGSVDILVEHAVAGPLTLVMPGSGLDPILIEYTYHAKGSAPYCSEYPSAEACQKPPTIDGGDGSGGGSTATTGTTGTGGTGTSGTGGDGSTGTSGTTADKVAPKVTIKPAVRQRPGVLRRSRQLVLRLTTNERSNYTVLPVGNQRATRVLMTKPRAQSKVVRIKLTGKLLKRIQASRAKHVVIAIRIVGIDANKNVVRKTIRLRVLR
ncbi:MAG: hypothetical protein KDC46_00105 [Thermoleophilia bacterium]|nr:hypothetical protein [Thermoleophilia bacterium]